METKMHDPHAALRDQAKDLRLYGLLSHWAEMVASPEQVAVFKQWLEWEAAERQRRSLERRLRSAQIGRFKPVADFDWNWPQQCERAAIEELMTLEFLQEAANVVL